MWPEKVRGTGPLHTASWGSLQPGPQEGPKEAEDLGGGRGVWTGAQPPLPPAEGLKKLFSGATMASSRGMLVTVGQVGLLLGVGFWGSARGPQPSERSQRKAVPLPAWTCPVHPAAVTAEQVLGQSGWVLVGCRLLSLQLGADLRP